MTMMTNKFKAKLAKRPKPKMQGALASKMAKKMGPSMMADIDKDGK